jgi:hypothetical protein
MKIPTEVKTKWESLKQHGDIESISGESNLSRHTITGALNGDECTMDVFTAIQNFYNKRQAEVDALINPTAE